MALAIASVAVEAATSRPRDRRPDRLATRARSGSSRSPIYVVLALAPARLARSSSSRGRRWPPTSGSAWSRCCSCCRRCSPTTAGGVPRRFLANPAVAWLGLVSYGIFLWHYAVTLDLGFDGDALSFWPLLRRHPGDLDRRRRDQLLRARAADPAAQVPSAEWFHSIGPDDLRGHKLRSMASAPEDTGYRFIAPVVGPDDERRFTDSGIEVEGLYDADDVGPGPRGAARRAGRVPLHPRDPRRACTATGSGRCASTPASPRPRTPTSATAT